MFVELLRTFSTNISIATAFILLILAVFYTIIFKALQIRALPEFIQFIIHGINKSTSKQTSGMVNSFYALFTAMSTSLGMGTIVGPSIAIYTGGPGALFWLIFYALCGSVIKYIEVSFGVHFRVKTADGSILGGPMQYLKHVSPALATWYACGTVALFTGWSSLQANVLAETLAFEHIPVWVSGAILAILVLILLHGGAQRIGAFNSALVPCMFIIYVTASICILYLHADAMYDSLALVYNHIFAPAPAYGGFLGASVWGALRSGVYKGAFITESGIGTAAIPHSMADVKKATDQGILAMSSVFVDTFLCFLSGLMVLVSGVWQDGPLRNTMIYEIFNTNFPVYGKLLLIICIILFVIGTIVGNSFNGRQSFAALTRYKYLNWYYLIVCTAIFIGSITAVPLVWEIIEAIMPLVVIPHIVGITYLAWKYRSVLRR